MRIAFSLGSLLTIPQVLDCAEVLSRTKTDTIWIPETWGMENFSMLSLIAQKTTVQKVGSSIINIYSRSPSTIAMGAATLDLVSKGRLILGLGTSSIPIVENFHGYKFENPVSRMREAVEIINLILSRKKINYSGKIFRLKDFTLLINPYRNKVPIYLAAVNEKMIKLALEIADGVIFYLRPLNEMKKTIYKIHSKRKIDVTCQIITCVDLDSEIAINRAKQTLAFYISVGDIYRKFLAENGFKTETTNIFEEFKISGFESNYKLISDNMLKSVAIAGTPDQCIKQMKQFRDTGLDLPTIQFNPVGNVKTSFQLLLNTFSGELK